MAFKKKQTESEETTPVRASKVRRINSDPRQGLSREQVSRRREEGYTNRPVEPPSKSVKEIVKDNVFTYFNYIFMAVSVLLVIAGSFKDLTFLPIIIANTLIGIIQEIRSKNTLDKLTMLHAPQAHVIREGKRYNIPASDLVLDDIVIFTAGAQIPADGTVVGGEVQVNESLITGESDEISKKSGDSLLSGSFIVSGRCLARMDRVGEDSYISKLTLEAKVSQEGERSEMMRSLTRLVKLVGILIIPIGIVLFIEQFVVQHTAFRPSIVAMVAAIIGMIPEGLYLLASVALVISVMRLAQKKVLVHEMACIETLARVDVLCVDKTGTITENTMETDGVITLPAYKKETMAPIDTMIGDFVHSMSHDNITMEALQNHFKQITNRRASSTVPFSSATKFSSVTFENETYVLGAPEFVLREMYSAFQPQIEKYSAEGHRVLVFGLYHGSVTPGHQLTAQVDPYALLLLSNPIRKEAPTTFNYFVKQGVAVKVISGDNPVTVSKVAEKSGIPNSTSYIDARTLKTEDDFKNAVDKYTVFGRVTPDQKRSLVQALQSHGHTVAMTGDGVNDVLALKDADCSIAMASGSDAAAQAAQLVLLDSDFSCMPSVVLEGRRVVNNIQRSASLFLVKNIFSFLMALFSIFTLNSYPLTPSQISLISTFTIGVPAFLLALEPNKERIKGKFLRNVFCKALPAGLTNFIVVGSMVVFGNVFGVNSTDVSTASTLLLAVVGLMILFHICKPMNLMRWGIWGGMIVCLIISILYFHTLFGITAISLKCGMLLTVFSIVTEPLFRYLTIVVEKLDDLITRLHERNVQYKERNKKAWNE